MDEMEITNLHKRNKARKTPQPKKAPNSPKSDEPKKRSSDGKRIAGKAGKITVRKTPQPKKAPKSAEFIGDSSNQEEEKEPKKESSDEKIPLSREKHQSHLNLLKQLNQVMMMNRSLKIHRSQASKKKKSQAMEKRQKQKKMVSRSGYHFFLREQLDQMTNRKNYRSIISEMWKKVKEDPTRLISYNNRARQMRDDTSATKKKVEKGKTKNKKTHSSHDIM